MFAHTDDQLTFADGDFPSIILNEDYSRNLDECLQWLLQNKSSIELELDRSGAVLFRGFPLHSAEDFDRFSGAFSYPSFTYQESLSNAVRINFTERVFTANEAPKDVEIFLHHEMAQTPISPQKIFFYCQSSASVGGATPVCRSDLLFSAFEELEPEMAEAFEKLGVKYTTYMPAENDEKSGQGRSWKDTLSVANRQEAEAKLAELGYSWDWLQDGSLKATTPTLPAVITHHGSKVFYNQLLAAYLGWKGVKENPDRALSFGDGSSIPKASLDLIADLSRQFTYDLAWQDSDMVLIDNRRVMHGRRPYEGDRKRLVLVALAA